MLISAHARLKQNGPCIYLSDSMKVVLAEHSKDMQVALAVLMVDSM